MTGGPAISAGAGRPDRLGEENAAGAGDRLGNLPGFAERVLDVVDAIPAGRVMTYGDIAEYLGEGGPRQVGRVMALWGGAVAWWRVVRADGKLLPGCEREALVHYREEGTPLRRSGPGGEPRLDMSPARWTGRVAAS